MKTLAIVTKGKNTCVALREQLENILDNRIKVSGYYVDESSARNISADLVVISGKRTYHEALNRIEKHCPVILARRSINYHEVDQLFDLPANTDVLLVNDLRSSAEDTISMLTALGIDHINYFPYTPGMRDYPRLKIAVTPGERNLAPDCVEKIIDIKTRIIDITTLTEILQNFSMLDEKANLLSANFVRDIIGLIKKSKQSSNASNRIRNQLQTIINTVHDGIIAVDAEQRISVFNPVAETFLGLKAPEVIGKTSSHLNNPELRDLFNTPNLEKEMLFKVNAHHLIVNTASIQTDDSKSGKIYTFKDVSEIQRMEGDLRRKLAGQLHIARYTLDHMYGNSEIVKKTVGLARKLAASKAPILLQGESGTGKELLAQGIHNASNRKQGPFIAINFAAMTESLLESELFGYEEGSFTGARKGGAAGLFEQAHKGTLFLDEVGDAPLSFQVKLLRVLQEKQVRRIGGSRLIPIDVRIISATNRDLTVLIAKGCFRQDLYYRLNVLPIALPSLRARKEDILVLATKFYDSYLDQRNRPISANLFFSQIAPALLSYEWPGNIRELQNVVEYLVNVTPDQIPLPDMLPKELLSAGSAQSSRISPEQHDINTLVLNAISTFNQQQTTIGRRSLAAALRLPESIIRKALIQLQQEGLIQIAKGRRGLSANRFPNVDSSGGRA